MKVLLDVYMYCRCSPIEYAVVNIPSQLAQQIASRKDLYWGTKRRDPQLITLQFSWTYEIWVEKWSEGGVPLLNTVTPENRRKLAHNGWCLLPLDVVVKNAPRVGSATTSMIVSEEGIYWTTQRRCQIETVRISLRELPQFL